MKNKKVKPLTYRFSKNVKVKKNKNKDIIINNRIKEWNSNIRQKESHAYEYFSIISKIIKL